MGGHVDVYGVCEVEHTLALCSASGVGDSGVNHTPAAPALPGGIRPQGA